MKTYNIVDRRERVIISIDPKESKDFDDAFGITDIDADKLLLSIYYIKYFIMD